ncbi:MAG: response regulator [Gammaproteobacteria bacterium]|nr:response regulator [Gammaproteobacteria bacterium]
MAIKQALIVDDSKSARVVLKRMLEELDLVVNTVESAIDAIDYLKKYQPDVIFMDHMMPGMDGFEAVKHIKNNSQTAVIPIMMYTSRGGDVYLSQARALGAVGIIPKTISPVGLKESLFKLGLIKDRRKPAEIDVKPIDIKLQEDKPDADKTEQQALEEDLLENQTKHDTYIEDLRRLMDDQTIELHKSMWLGIESVSHEIFNRLSSELEQRFDKLQTLPQDVADELTPKEENIFRSPVFLVGVLLVLSIVLNITLLSVGHQAEEVVIANTNMQEQIVVSEEPAQIKQVPVDNHEATVEFIKWAQNKTIEYPFNELALNDKRLARIEELVKRALEANYTGSIILQTHVGKFCMNRDENGIYTLADDDLSVTACDYIGNHLQPTDAPATHQSLSFANYLSDSGLLDEKGIEIEVTNESRIFETSAYPRKIPETKVQGWNLAAHLNNRVTVKLKPASFGSVVETERDYFE